MPTDSDTIDHPLARQIVWLSLWAVAFAFIESSVVVYLRKIYYPEGFAFPLTPIEPNILLNELVREAMTLVVIWTTAQLSYTRLQSRVAAFLILFGIWDIFYYIFLKIVLDWPASFGTWDILFLIPTPWVGPVWAPMLVAITLAAFGICILKENANGRYIPYSWRFVMLEGIAGAIIVLSFIIPGIDIFEGGDPGTFPSAIFWIGYLFGLIPFLRHHYKSIASGRK